MTSVPARPSDAPPSSGPSEFEILKRNHRFLREDGNTEDKPTSWDDALAKKFYANLWKEFALCDLKHYKSGDLSLRWRTENELISGAGETSCGNTRCKYHDTNHKRLPVLSTLELPFGYIEKGEAKSALVKVVLCPKCVKKVMWHRQQAKRKLQPPNDETVPLEDKASPAPVTDEDHKSDSKRRRRSRSKSPRRKK